MKLIAVMVLLAQLSFAQPIVNAKLKKAVKKSVKTELCGVSATGGEVLFVEDTDNRIVKDVNVFKYGTRLRQEALVEDGVVVGAQFSVDDESFEDDITTTQYNVDFSDYSICEDRSCFLSTETVPVCTGNKVRNREAVVLR